MKKVFIFDLDGVLINDEPMWEEAKKEMYLELFGQEIFTKLGSTVGINIDGIYEKAIEYGSKLPKEKLVEAFYKRAPNIYKTAPLPEGLKLLGDSLVALGFTIAIVSASPKDWINIVISRLPFKDNISYVLSLYDRPDLPHKPSPDGYLEAFKELKSTPEATIVLEDSNAGIASAKAAGAFTIGLKQNLVNGYTQKGADVYAENLEDVVSLVTDIVNRI